MLFNTEPYTLEARMDQADALFQIARELHFSHPNLASAARKRADQIYADMEADKDIIRWYKIREARQWLRDNPEDDQSQSD